MFSIEKKMEEKRMITTTTPSIEGKKIVEYKGIVFGEVVSGVNFVKDIAASFSNFFGGRSEATRKNLLKPEKMHLERWNREQLQWAQML